MTSDLAQPQAIDSKRMSAVTTRLKDIKYSHRETARRLGMSDHLLWKTESLFTRMNRISEGRAKQPPQDALDEVIDLLFLNIPTPQKKLGGWLGSEVVSALEDMRIIRVDDNAAHCDLTLSEFRGLFIASDTMWGTPADEPFVGGAVLNPIFDSYMFASTFGTRPAKRCLDLCTGSGVLGLHASRASREVIAVDLYERPLEFARFNKALNGISNIEFVQGDMYAGLQGRFGRIVSNPPYLPDDQTAPGDNFYSGGISGDVLTVRILEGLDQYLEDDGYCYLLTYLIYNERAGRPGLTMAPDLWRARKTPNAIYDVVLLTYDSPFRDLTVTWEHAKFDDAARVEFGPYVLHKRVNASRDPWFLRAPSVQETELEVEKLVCELETSLDPQRILKSYGVKTEDSGAESGGLGDVRGPSAALI